LQPRAGHRIGARLFHVLTSVVIIGNVIGNVIDLMTVRALSSTTA